jgi:hypothetical protein
MKTKQKTQWEQSVFGKIKGKDLLNALAHAIGSAVPTFFGLLNVEVIINSFRITMQEALIATALTFLSSFCFDVVKRFSAKKNN